VRVSTLELCLSGDFVSHPPRIGAFLRSPRKVTNQDPKHFVSLGPLRGPILGASKDGVTEAISAV
jgi:hypothetical protein